jgi:hypothetical protein
MIQLPPLKKLEEIDFNKIIKDFDLFIKGKNTKFKLPRITFIGNFRFLSMTDQRHICNCLGFEYYQNIQMATDNENEMQSLSSKWSDITKSHTRLVVIGMRYSNLHDWRVEMSLFKKYKKDPAPLIYENKIPCIMEEELWKLHVDYPKISNNTVWKDGFMKSTFN